MGEDGVQLNIYSKTRIRRVMKHNMSVSLIVTLERRKRKIEKFAVTHDDS